MAWDLPDEFKPLLDKPKAGFESAEKRHKSYRKRWDRYYRLYRSHQQFREQYQNASEPDRDQGLRDMQREWGAELFIPYSFEVVETILPRAVSNRPRMLVLPRADTREENVENMRMLVDSQQEQVAYELKLQETAKSGFIYGLGIQKSMWRRDVRQVPVLERATDAQVTGSEWVQGTGQKVLFDDPDCENVDIFDFFWDPFASELRRGKCKWALHRTWRDTGYCQRMLIQGAWNNPSAFPPSEVKALASTAEFETAHRERMEAGGQEQFDMSSDDLHEVWEWHDGEQVITILDRQVPVQADRNPAWHGDLPFQAYRPNTSGIKELPGIGEIEPIEHLQYEINTLRSQRRDNSSFVLQRAFAYADGLVDPDNLKVGPGTAIPVNGDPRELLFPLPVQDIPASGYQEEEGLKADIERVTGISDSVTGASDGAQTATGVQLVQAAANFRIQAKTRRLEVEVIYPEAAQWVSLNQQKITSERKMAFPEPGSQGERWKQVKLGPAELAGDMFIVCEGGSTAPDNPAEQLQRAQFIWNMFRDNPAVDQKELLRHVIRLSGVKQPDTWLAPDQRIPLPFLNILLQQLEKQGLPQPQAQEAIQQMLGEAQQVEDQQKAQAQGLPTGQQGPPAQQAA